MHATHDCECAEIHRSRYEAEHTSDSTLLTTRRNLARYHNPPLETPYPLEYTCALLGDLRGKTVLDLGCGSGANTLLLAGRGAQVYGIDISESLIAIARRRLRINRISEVVNFIVCSAHQVPLAAESVDVVLGVAILHHLDLEIVSREVKRVLRKGGRAIFQEPVRNSPAIQKIRALIPYRARNVSAFERPLTDVELEAFAEGFSRYRTRAFSLPFLNVAQVLPVVSRHIHPAYRLDRAILLRLPRLAYYGAIRVIELQK
jgi:SAM-dependent methyltransferase